MRLGHPCWGDGGELVGYVLSLPFTQGQANPTNLSQFFIMNATRLGRNVGDNCRVYTTADVSQGHPEPSGGGGGGGGGPWARSTTPQTITDHSPMYKLENHASPALSFSPKEDHDLNWSLDRNKWKMIPIL